MSELNEKTNEDTTLHIDYDIIAFNASSAMEERSIVATHKTSGRKMPFKNRTEFYGRGKTIGGWLGSLNEKNEASGKTVFTKDDFEIEDIYTHAEDVSHVFQSAKTKLNNLCKHLGIHNYCGVAGSGPTFRHSFEMPKEYKSERDPHKPFWLKDTKDYLISKHNGSIAEVVEADDIIVQGQYKGWRNYKKTGIITDIALSIDKDSLSTPGFLFNFNKNQSTGKYKYPEVIIIDDGIGDLWVNEKGKSKEVKGYGSYWLAYQLLLGDSTDTIRSYQDFGIKYGEQTFYKEAVDIKTQAELFTFVKDKYHLWFPNGVSFTSWTGKEMEISTDEWIETIFRLVYMQRVPNDPTTFAKMLQHYQSKA